MNDLNTFNKIVKVRDAYKKVMQLSYNLNLIEKKFPVQTLEPTSYKDMLKIYSDFYEDLLGATREVLMALNDNK